MSGQRSSQQRRLNPDTVTTFEASAPSQVVVRNVSDVRFIWKCASGTSYTFNPNESKPVAEEDAGELLALQRHGGGCCGPMTTNNYFVREI